MMVSSWRLPSFQTSSLNICMDKDIKEIRRRAGIEEQQTYTLGKQENIDELVTNEVEFLAKTAKYLDNMSFKSKRTETIEARKQ